MSLAKHIRASLIILIVVTRMKFLLSHNNFWHLQKSSLHRDAVIADEPSKKAPDRLIKTLIGDDGRVYACSGKDFLVFESNGSISWTVRLNYSCNPKIAPVHGGSSKVYLVAENKLLKIHPFRIKTSEETVEVFFDPGKAEIIGFSVSVFSSCAVINVRNRGLFAFKLHGQLIWSGGPMLYRHGYRQGCKKNITYCYFASEPVIDHCEASIYILNNVGELYSISVRGPYFKWIQDLSFFGNNIYTITPAYNGRLYITIPYKGIIFALNATTGNISWQGNTGPLSSADYEPIVDSNGWISHGSLDGYLYSFSPSGDVKKFPRSAKDLNSVIQVNPLLDCSGYAVYISQTEMEGKVSQIIGEYVHVSTLMPKSATFTLMNPASGFIYQSEIDPSKTLSNLSRSDLRRFVMDERTLLSFYAASRTGNPLPCRTTRQKVASICSLVKPKGMTMYTGNERKISFFLVIESVILVLLAATVRYCCNFWNKRKLQSQDLGKFLEKRRSLRAQKKEFDRMITKIERTASEDDAASEMLQKLSHWVDRREGVDRKLSTTYSLGRDCRGNRSHVKSLLPLFGKKTRSFSFRGSKEESVTAMFHSLSDGSSCYDASQGSSYTSEADSDMSENERLEIDESEVKGKKPIEVENNLKKRSVSFA